MSSAPPIASLLPHRPPFRFVDDVVRLTADCGVFTLHLAAADPRLTEGKLAPLMLVEALAQSTAAFNGAAGGGRPETGLLVRIDAAELRAGARAGDDIQLEVRPAHRLGAMVRFVGEARCTGRLLARAELTVLRQSLEAT